MPALEQRFWLGDAPGGLGLNCEATGVSLAGVPLLLKTSEGFKSRPTHEIDVLMKGAYGGESDVIRLASGLQVAAEALNRSDIGRAMIATLHLRLPELDWNGAARIARAADVLAKYDPSEPRDERGRWTTGGATGAEASAKPARQRAPIPAGPVGQPRGSSGPSGQAASGAQSDREDLRPSQSWGGQVHLYGGQVTPIGGPGSNGPPEEVEAEPIPPAEPDYNPSRVPEGFDQPGHRAGGLEYPPSRHPTFPDGKPWPVATHDVVKATLAPRGKNPPYMVLFVPVDGRGDILAGSDGDKDYERPEGYDEVRLIGTPQVTTSRGNETNHARDSIEEALDLAESNRFSTIYFNRSLVVVTNRTVESLIRPDVFAIVRPNLNIGFRYDAYESLSDGQRMKERETEYPKVPGLVRPRGEPYKKSMRLSPEECQYLGVRYLCS